MTRMVERCVLALFLFALPLIGPGIRPASAALFYDFREAGTGAIRGTIGFSEPPASASSAWTSLDGAIVEVFSFSFDGTPDDVLALGSVDAFDVSASPAELIAGGITLRGPFSPPEIEFQFGPVAGGDTVSFLAASGFSTRGDWLLRVPAPGSLVIVGLGGLAAALADRRRRRALSPP